MDPELKIKNLVAQMTAAVIVCLVGGSIGEAGESNRDRRTQAPSDMLDIMDKAAEDDDSKDTQQCEKMSYSALCDQWIKAYLHGKPGQSDLIWVQILKKMEGVDSIYILVLRLHYRLNFDAPDSATKCNIIPYCNSLAAATESCHGKYDSFLWDILGFESDNLEKRLDYKAVVPLRQRILSIARKMYGAESERYGYPALDLIYAYCKTKQYEQAERLCKEILAVAERHHYKNTLADIVRLYGQVLAAENRRDEAHALRVKYSKVLKE